MQLGEFGFWQMLRNTTPEMAREAEDLGYGAVWVGGSPKGDLRQVEALIDATDRIPVVTGIVNMWREDAEVVAAAYHRIDSAHPDRLVLGVGIGHPEATQEYRDPVDKIGEYLDQLDAARVPGERTVLAALGPRVLRIAADRTAGAHPYLTSPRHTAFARRVIGEGPLLAPDQKVVLDTDPERAREVGRFFVKSYLSRVNYRRNLVREGWAESDIADGGSDTLIDALFLHGTPEQIAAGLRTHLDAGADHVGVHVVGDDTMAGYRTLAEVLF
jgi:probable F420-dependent oxidoreductase